MKPLRKISLLIIISVFAACFTGCKTTKYVPIPVTVSEQNQNTSIDSVLNKRFIEAFEKLMLIQEKNNEINVKQVVREKDSILSIYDDTGNKIREDRFHIKESNTESSEITNLKEKLSYMQNYIDSCSVYKSTIDSLKNLKEKVTPYYIERKLNVVQKLLVVLGAIFGCLILLYFLLVIKNIIINKFRC